MRRGPSRIPAVASAVAVLAACAGEPSGAELDVFRGSAFGTSWQVSVASEGLAPERRSAVAARIEATLERVDALMSHYREDSELSRFNRSEGTAPFPVSRETLEVLSLALEVGGRTGGALDVTVAPLVDAWGFGPGPRPEALPDDARVEALLEQVGLDRIAVDPATSTVARTRPGVRLDLSAVAKGYAVDLVAEALTAEGLENVLVEVGGEVRASGRNTSGAEWRIGVELPESALPALHGIVPLSGRGLATSGEYRNYRVVDGVRASHTIDPRTGRPIRHALASVTVIADTCARADALATALNVLGPEEGWDLAVEGGIAALFLVADGEGGFRDRRTPAFAKLAPPRPQRGAGEVG